MLEGCGSRTEVQEVDSYGYFTLAWRAVLIAMASVLLAAPGVANDSFAADFSVPGGTIDLLTDVNVRIDGAAERDYVSASVAGAGDVNGDGRDDVIIGAPNADNNGRSGSGSVYVIYGKDSIDSVDLSALDEEDGFRIDGAANGDGAGFSVAGAGDVNGDDLADVIIGAPNADNSENESGSAYIVYGTDSNVTIDLNELGESGFRIDGIARYDWTGYSVAGAGDVNDDGRDDVIVGAPFAGFEQPYAGYGSAYVVFGKGSTDSVNLDGLDEGGFRIDSAAMYDTAGWSVSGAGDVNDDGLDDVIVGANGADNNDRPQSGSAYVIFGRRDDDGTVEHEDAEGVDLAGMEERGFRIDGAAGGDIAGFSVARAGDVNDDGLDDVIVGSPRAGNNDRPLSGSAYVIYGRNTTDSIDLNALDVKGFRIDGAVEGDGAGAAIAGAGDVNGDGGADLIVGAPYASNNGLAYSGAAHLLYRDAQPDTTPVPEAKPDTKNKKTLSGLEDVCTRSVYENRLEAPREVHLRSLVKGKGVKAKASASETSKATLKLEVVGEDARRLRLYGKKSKKKSKLVAQTKLNVSDKQRGVYIKAHGRVRKLIKRVLENGKAPKRVRLKLTLTTHSTANTLLAKRNTLTIRAYKSTKQRTAKTNTRVSRMHGGSGCAEPLQLKIKGPRTIGISSLISRSAGPGKGVRVKVRCSENCTARVGIRMWGRFEVGSGLRKTGKKKPRWLTKRTVKLKAGQTKTITLEGPSSKRLRKQLQRAALKKRYKRIKLKYSIEARTADKRSNGGAGTVRVPLRFG